MRSRVMAMAVESVRTLPLSLMSPLAMNAAARVTALSNNLSCCIGDVLLICCLQHVRSGGQG